MLSKRSPEVIKNRILW